jgi:type IV conjugative transfer system coupling protein TraD
MLNFFTRGGQITLHTFHMFKQVSIATILISLCVGMGVMTFQFWKQTTPYQRYLYKEMLAAEWRVNMSQNDTSKAVQEFEFENGVIREVKSEALLKDPRIQKHLQYIDNLFSQNWRISLGWALATLVLLMGSFIYGGYLKSKKKLERGNHIVSNKQLRGVLKRADLDSDLHLDKLPLVLGKETSHILISGTTSSGKTNCFHTLLPQIRNRMSRGSTDRAIVVDLTGDYVSRYYRDSHDILLNPFDARSKSWSPWADLHDETHYDALAVAIVPKTSAHDKFWENAGKALLASALKEMAKRGEQDIQQLYHLLVQSDMSEFCKFFQNTDAAPYTHPDGEKMTLSIRATLANALQGFRFLKPTTDGFSIRKWVTQEQPSFDPWLFLSIKPDQRETLLPLLSAWLDTAINALMTLNPDSERRLWFIIDELPALQKLPSLGTAMAESRKYGGCVLAGIQSFPQLSHTYGQHQAQSILDQFNTKIFFRNTDPTITAWISKVLGEAEITEQHENLSYGANSIRDGVSLSPQTRTKPLVLPTEIANLRDLEAFVKFPGQYPVCRTRLTYKKTIQIAPGFIPLIQPQKGEPTNG